MKADRVFLLVIASCLLIGATALVTASFLNLAWLKTVGDISLTIGIAMACMPLLLSLFFLALAKLRGQAN